MPYAPNNPGLYQFGSTPMFGAADSVPHFTGPVNINVQGNAAGSLLQLGLPALLQGPLQQRGMMMGQLLPAQNIYDQMVAQQFVLGQQRAMHMSARRDSAFIEDFLGGGTRLLTGRDTTAQDRQRNFVIAQQASQMLPMAINLFGPDRVDQLLGGRSAAVMAHHMFRAGRTAVDPVSGQIGMSADSSSLLSDDIFERLYGRGANPAAIKSLRTRHMGGLMEEMQARGMMGTGARGAVARTLDEGTVQRLAERLPEMQGVTANTVGHADRLEQAKDKIRASHASMAGAAAAGASLGPQDIGRLAGGDDILRVSDAQRITQKLKNMSGAVQAMREIFGDMGHPGAPMREIMNGLDALTQGGLAHMSPAQIERTVRTTHAIARQTGLGMQAMLGLTAQAANMADALGVDRSLAVQATQGAALFGAAVGNSGGLDIPAWRSLNKEQLTLVDQQLRMQAAASGSVNQVNAMLRMADEGIMKAGAGTETAAILAAAREGKSSYTFNGETKSMLMNRTQMMDMIKQDTGISNDTATTYLMDTYGNQEYAVKYGTTDLGRELQREESMKLAAGSFANRVSVASQGQLGKALNRQLGEAMSSALFSMDPSVRRNAEARQQAMAGTIRDTLRDHVRQQMPNAGDAQVEAEVSRLEQSFGGADTLAGSSWAAFNTALDRDARTAAFGGAHGYLDAMSNHPETRRQRREAEASASIASALSGIGFGTPLEKFATAIADATPETTAMDILAQSTIGVQIGDLSGTDAVANGVMQALNRSLGVERDKNGMITTKGMASREDEAKLIQALSEGGDTAAAEYERRVGAGMTDPEVLAQLGEAHRNGGLVSRMARRGYKPGQDYSGTDQFAGAAPDEAKFFEEQGSLPLNSAEQAASSKREETGTAKAGTAKMSVEGTLTIIAPDKGGLKAIGTGDPNFTPVAAGN
jgi:hypothetical protein